MKSPFDKLAFPCLALFAAAMAEAPANLRAAGAAPMGCIIATDTRERYCLGLDSQSDGAIPEKMRNKVVDVHADSGISVTLTAAGKNASSPYWQTTLVGTVTHGELASTFVAGNLIDFSRPLRMSVESSSLRLGCIVALGGPEKFCRPAGAPDAYILPSWIVGKDVSVQADPGIVVSLSDKANLGFGTVDIGQFTGVVSNESLKNVSVDGRSVDFSKPYWMSTKRK